MAEKHVDQVRRGRQRLQEPSGPPIVRAVVLLCALLAWLLAGLAVGASGRWSTPSGVASTFGIGLLAGLLIGAATRATASGALRSRREVV
ncbi:MAG: hypothetical protein WA317_06845, partial [Mycobacterium sp.]